MTEHPPSAEALPSDIQHLLDSLDTDVALHLAARIKARIARLEDALKPFADIADAYAAVADKEGHKHHSDGHRVSIGLGECRAAREALSQFRSNP